MDLLLIMYYNRTMIACLLSNRFFKANTQDTLLLKFPFFNGLNFCLVFFKIAEKIYALVFSVHLYFSDILTEVYTAF